MLAGALARRGDLSASGKMSSQPGGGTSTFLGGLNASQLEAALKFGNFVLIGRHDGKQRNRGRLLRSGDGVPAGRTGQIGWNWIHGAGERE